MTDPAPGSSVAQADPASTVAGDSWAVRGRVMDLSKPLVMGILNVTPDSFSDGGTLRSVDDAVARGRAMAEAGAGILDVGGESTRPGAEPVPPHEEVDRVCPVVEALVGTLDVPVSVDTRKAAVAQEALAAGAAVVNDVSGLAFDPALGSVVAQAGAGLVLMHMRGDPATMQEHTDYRDLLDEVVVELDQALDRAARAGVPRERVVLDPGIGFAKTADQNLELLRELERLSVLGRPLLVGPSRKSFLGHVLGLPPGERVAGTVAACLLAWGRGARIFRVHDVAPVAQALSVAEAVKRVEPGGVRRREGRA